MFRTDRIIMWMLTAVVFCGVAQAGENLPAAAEWIPQDAVICMELSQPGVLLDFLANDEACKAIGELDAYKKLAANPKFEEFLGVIKLFEVSLETDWRTGLGSITGGGVTFAVCPNETVILIIDAEDEKMLVKLHELLLNIARSEAAKKGEPETVGSVDVLGVKAWTFNGKESHAIIGNRFILSNKPEGLKAALELRAASEAESLAKRKEYLAAKKVAGSAKAGMLFADLELLKHIPGLAQVLQQDKTNPLAALLFAGVTEAVRNSTWLAMGLEVQDDTLVLNAHMDGRGVDPAGPAGFAVPKKADQGAMPNLCVPRRIAAISLYRDLHSFYASKDDLFGERTSGLIFFENMMGIFFTGRDLTDEVLAETTPDVRLVVARQAYDSDKGVPAVQIPAFALVLRLRDAEDFDPVAEEAWQKAIGLVNFTRGQQAMPGLIIDRPIHNGEKFTASYFSTAGVEETGALHSRFNYRPSLALPEDYLILSSTDQLAQDLIDTVKNDKTGEPLAQMHSIVELDAGELASILQANYIALVRQNMIKEGNTQEAAEAATDVLIAVARFINHVKLSIGTREALTNARLEIRPNLK